MSKPSENITLLRDIYGMVKIQKEEIFLLKNELKCIKNLIITINDNLSKCDNDSINTQPISNGWIWG